MGKEEREWRGRERGKARTHELLPKAGSFSNLGRLRRSKSVEPDSNGFLGTFGVYLKEREIVRRQVSTELLVRTRRDATRETHLHLSDHVVVSLLDVLELVENFVDLDLLQRRVVVSLELVRRTQDLGDLLSFLDGRLVHLFSMQVREGNVSEFR